MASLLLLILLLLTLSLTPSQASGPLPAPQQVALEADRAAQRLSVTWEGAGASSFDVLIQRTELMDTVFNETVVLQAEAGGKYQWSWTSAEPLECTSLSVSLRSREGSDLSTWSTPQILPGLDVPSNADAQMYPEGRVVPVGTNTTFCCIIPEGQGFGSLTYKGMPMIVNRLSRRSYATTRTNQEPSATSGTNVICSNNNKRIVTGAVVFVGYPPQPSDLVCESRDLVSAECQWATGRDTHLYSKKRQTYYTLNGKNCSALRSSWDPRMVCGLDRWDGNWTLEAKNPLGRTSLTDSAELGHRVRPVAPSSLATAEVGAWNTTLQWQWPYPAYDSLALLCQVQLTSYWHSNTHTSTGAGLKTAVLPGLQPDEEYSAKVRCGSQKNFWKWGNWSTSLTFRTKMDRPEAPDVWVWMDSNNTGRIIWKPLTKRESHGQVSGYEVTLWSPEENRQHSVSLPQSHYSLSFNLSSPDSRTVVRVTARNPAGVSAPASVGIPTYPGGVEAHVSRAVFSETGFPLSWPAEPAASCAYVVQWHNSTCSQDCSLDWTKVPPERTNVTIQSDNFLAGVRYSFSLYSNSCASNSENPELQQSWQGYTQELAPSRSVPRLSSNQYGSVVQLTWEEIPLEHQRGFILGYCVYVVSASQLTLLANISEPSQRNYTVRNLPLGSYKFTVKSYNSAGEDGGSTVSISLEPYTDWLILEILVTLGIMACFLALVTTICYRKRTWVKKAFYPDIPEPKLPGDWSRAQGTLDVKPSPHSIVHIENPERDSSKDALVVVPEEEEEEEEEGSASGNEPADTDSDEPTTLRYYNQVVDHGSPRQRPRRLLDSSASSASSVDSARTDVTYTGIQTSASSLALQPAQPDPPAQPVSAGYRPQMHPASGPGPAEPHACLEEQPSARGGAGGYQPQCSWRLDSPVESGGLAPSMGSPTSVTSSQFLLPDTASEEEGKGQTSWFHNLLSGKP